MTPQKKWISIGIVVIALFAFGKYNEDKKAKEIALEPKEVVKAKVIMSFSEQFEERNFDELRGGYKPVKRYLKETLNDPSSLEIDKTWNLGMNKDSTFAIKTTFRAKNEHNALILQSMYCNVDIKGNLSEIRFE